MKKTFTTYHTLDILKMLRAHLFNGYSISKTSLIVNLNIESYFVDVGALSVEIFMLDLHQVYFSIFNKSIFSLSQFFLLTK